MTNSSEKWLKDQKSKNIGPVFVFHQLPENAIEVLDKYVHSKYSQRVWMRNHGMDEEYPEEYEDLQKEIKEIKKVAKVFGLYPYNQPMFLMENDL